jgi:hypothetical protein
MSVVLSLAYACISCSVLLFGAVVVFEFVQRFWQVLRVTMNKHVLILTTGGMCVNEYFLKVGSNRDD